MKLKLPFLFLLIITNLAIAAEPQKDFLNGAVVIKNKNIPVKITNLNTQLLPDKEVVHDFLMTKFIPAFNLGRGIEPVYKNQFTDNGLSIVKFNYSYKGLPVEGSASSIAVKSNKILWIKNSLGKINIPLLNFVKPDKAVESIIIYKTGTKPIKLPDYAFNKVIVKIMGKYVPAYKIKLSAVTLLDTKVYYVSAKTGNYLYSTNNIAF